MAFIPIDAKADIQGSKKGKLTPAQHAQINAWCLAKKTGILDCLGRCEATQLNYTTTTDTVKVVFNDGYIVICGRFIECEKGTGFEITVPVTGSVAGKIVLRCDLSSNKEKEFEIISKTDDLKKQDLNENPLTGIYEFELYSYIATPTGITLSRNNKEYIPDITTKLEELSKKHYVVVLDYSNQLFNNNELTELAKTCFFFTVNKDNVFFNGVNLPRWSKGYWISTGMDVVFSFTDKEKMYTFFYDGSSKTITEPVHRKSEIAEYASNDRSKGTIEERLTSLGFKQGSVTGISGATLTKQGKYAILFIPAHRLFSNGSGVFDKSYSMSFTAKQRIVTYGSDGFQVTIEGSAIKIYWDTNSGEPENYTIKPMYIGFEISSW